MRQPPSLSANKQNLSIARPPQQNSQLACHLLDATSTAPTASSHNSCTPAPTAQPPLARSPAELLDTSIPARRVLSAIVAAQLHPKACSPTAAGSAAPATPCNLVAIIGVSTSISTLWLCLSQQSFRLASLQWAATQTRGPALSATDPTPTLPTPTHSVPPCAHPRDSSTAGPRATNAGAVTHSPLPSQPATHPATPTVQASLTPLVVATGRSACIRALMSHRHSPLAGHHWVVQSTAGIACFKLRCGQRRTTATLRA